MARPASVSLAILTFFVHVCRAGIRVVDRGEGMDGSVMGSSQTSCRKSELVQRRLLIVDDLEHVVQTRHR